jgi:hypothetical protein
MTTIRDEFSVHILNGDGIAKANQIAQDFSELLSNLETTCGSDGREMAIVRTKLQEAAFFAKRAMAIRPENQVR